MLRTPTLVTLALGALPLVSSAQSATLSLSSQASSVAPGTTVAIDVVVSYDLAGAGAGAFGAAGFYGFGGDVSATGSGAADIAAASASLDPQLASGPVAELGTAGALVRAAAGRGLSGGLPGNPQQPLSFDLDIDPTAQIGSVVTVSFDGSVVLVRGDALETFSTSPGVGQSSLQVNALTLTIGTGACSAADITTTGSANGVPDGGVDLSDFSFYLSLWSAGTATADLTTTGTANGIPDGSTDLSDFSFYLSLWSAGCP